MPSFDDGQSETELPTTAVVETDVVVVGSGPAGSAAALALSTLGVANIMITKYRWTANTPRAHITNQRAMEVFRDLGIEQQVLADATPHELVGDTVFCTSIAGEEIGRILTWGTSPAREADYQLASDVQYEPGLYGIAVAPDREQLRDALQATLETMVASGAYEKVLEDWDVADGAVRTVSVNAGARSDH